MSRVFPGSLKLGVLDLVPQSDNRSAEIAVAEAVRLAKAAEEWGYGRYWAAEHHDLPGLACAAPEVLLAHIGAVTRRIRLGTGALLLPHYSPLKVAETFRLLAALYPGRIDLGIGRAPGGPAHASLALSGNFLQRVYGMRESLDSLIRLLEDSYTLEGTQVIARPVPKEGPALWLLGTGKKSADFAASTGSGFVFGGFMSGEDGESVISAYRQNFVPSERLKEPKVIAAVGVLCAETSGEALKLAEQSRRRSAEDREESGRLQVTGSVQEAVDKLITWSELYNTDEFLVITPLADQEARLRSYRLLAEYTGL